jgi:hypothetical protein
MGGVFLNFFHPIEVIIGRKVLIAFSHLVACPTDHVSRFIHQRVVTIFPLGFSPDRNG